MKNFIFLCFAMLLMLTVFPAQSAVFEQDNAQVELQAEDGIQAVAVTAVTVEKGETHQLQDQSYPKDVPPFRTAERSGPLTTFTTPRIFELTGRTSNFLYHPPIRGDNR